MLLSDWLVLASPWLIPYERFVIRIAEEDFLKNPNECLDYLLKEYKDKVCMYVCVLVLMETIINKTTHIYLLI